MLVVNYDFSQLLLFNISTSTGTLTNVSGSTVSLPIGTIVGRIDATKLIVAQVSTATDGSQVPIGVVIANYSIPTGASQVVTYAIAGEIAQDMLKFGGSDTISTEISANSTNFGTIGDILNAKGLIWKSVTNVNYFDEQGS